MSIKYEEVLPWGRNYDEYRRMFDLNDAEITKKIIGCGDGPASFNAHCNAHGGHVASVDPIYKLSKNQIALRIDETFKTVIEQTGNNSDKFLWKTIKNIEELGAIRMKAMNDFLDDFDSGKSKSSYICGALPSLPFVDGSFDIALSSHFLFLYTDNLSFDFHLKSIHEMLRVAREARIFPLLDANAKKSKYLDKIMEHFSELNIEIRKVNYEFQKDGNEMLVVSTGG
jgi:predicted SAM-dependent methyltransferase